MPPAVSLLDIGRVDSCLNPKTLGKKILHFTQKDLYKFTCYRASRELRVSKCVKNWIGRTDWDCKASQMLSPGSNYYHCDEMMRLDFSDKRWQFHYDNKVIRIHSSLSSEWYKGIDVILKTAHVLKELGANIEWNVYGVSQLDEKVLFFTRKFDVNPDEVNVCFRGRVDGCAIRESLNRCDVFVHPSYIENSSNAIAEAMMMGVPSIAHFVGGNPSMLRDNSGVLVPPNEPYILAEAILKMRDKDVAEAFSKRAMMVARDRQNSQNILRDLRNIYETVANSK